MLEGVITSLWNVSRVKIGAVWSYGATILTTIIVIKLLRQSKPGRESRIINERKEGIDKNDTRKNPQGLVSSLGRKAVMKM